MTQKYDNQEEAHLRSVTALFPGSFNPFTVGHESIVNRALQFCDKVVIAVGINIDKAGSDAERNIICHEAEKRRAEIEKIFKDNPHIDTAVYKGLTGDFACSINADFILRGVRNGADFDYEYNMANANRNIFGIETILLPSLPELAWISSSTVRELRHFGHDVTSMLPSHDNGCNNNAGNNDSD